MLSRLLNFSRPKALRERCVRDLAAASNAMDYDRIVEYLTDDFIFADVGGAFIEGSEVWAKEDRRFREAAGNPTIVIESLDHNGEEVLVRGHFEGGIPEVSGDTMWRIQFRGNRIARVEVTRASMNVTLPTFASRQVSQDA